MVDTVKFLNIYYQNCRSIRNRLLDLRLGLLNSNYDVIVLTETWLRAGICDSEIADDRYYVYRRDRCSSTSTKKDGGGVLIAIKKNICSYRKCDWESPCVEEIILLLPSVGHGVILVASYIPPLSGPATYDVHFNKLYDIAPDYVNHNFILMGDYNQPGIRWWPDGDQNLDCGSINAPYFMTNIMSFLNLKQCNSIKNVNDRLLDLVFTDSNCDVALCTSSLINIDPQHPPLVCEFHIPRNRSTIGSDKVIKYNFRKADYSQINAELSSIDWCQSLDSLGAQQAVDFLYTNLYRILDTYVPPLKLGLRRYPSWFSQDLKMQLNKKYKFWKRWKIYGSRSDYDRFSWARAKVKKLIISCYDEYILHVEQSTTHNIKSFWKFTHSLKNSKTGYPSSMKLRVDSSSDPAEICKMFSNYFVSVFEPTSDRAYGVDDDNLMDCVDPAGVCVSSMVLSCSDVRRALRSVDVNKGAGPDRITPFFLRNVSDVLCMPLTIIYNKSLSEGFVPLVWKTANITPVYKSGARNDVENYRPISILSCIVKIFERLIHDKLYPLLKISIPLSQHGFVESRSTVSNLLVYSNFIFQTLDHGASVDSIYTDFRKAFDKVDHLILLRKLFFNGVRGDLLRWFASYLRCRHQSVVLNGYSSSSCVITSGVPQGSILGPFLFILYIYDIHKCFLNSNILLYADDLKIYKKINTRNDCLLLQDDINRFTLYCSLNRLSLATDKCRVMTFSRKRFQISHNYTLSGQVLNRVTSIRDLGVMFDSKLLFDQHIRMITDRAYQMLGFICRTSGKFRLQSTYLTLYRALVRSQLEYGSAVWNPYYEVYKGNMESVQRKFSKMVFHRLKLSQCSYEMRLSHLKLPTLEVRRLLLGAMTLRNICLSEVDCPDLLAQIDFRVPRPASRLSHVFAQSKCHTNAGRRAPLVRLCSDFNHNFCGCDFYNTSVRAFKNEIRLIFT